MAKPISICGHLVRPGHRASVMLRPVADPAAATTPIHVIHGHDEGPVLFISAAIHGDELNGIEIVRRLLRMPSVQSLRGTLLAVQVVNVAAFRARRRSLPEGDDLNRRFPGSAEGTDTERVAHCFMHEVVARADYGIDLHSATAQRSNLPQIRADLLDAETRRLAEAFGAPVMIHAREPRGTLRHAAVAQGVPTLLYEGGTALSVEEPVIDIGVRGILNVMRAIGMVASPHTTEAAGCAPLSARTTLWVRALCTGRFCPTVPLGILVAREQAIGVVATKAGKVRYVRSPCDGMVVGKSLLSEVKTGEALFNIARLTPVMRMTQAPAVALTHVRSPLHDCT